MAPVKVSQPVRQPVSQEPGRLSRGLKSLTHVTGSASADVCLSALLIPDQWPGLVVFNRRSDAAHRVRSGSESAAALVSCA